MAAVKGGLILKREVPSGVVDGTNVNFNTSRPYISGTLMVYLNGLCLTPPDDFAEGIGTAFVMVQAPSNASGYVDKLLVTYQIK